MGAIGKCQLHRFGDNMQPCGFVEGFQVEVLQNIQNLGHVYAAGAGRGERGDFVTAISRENRLAQDDLVISKILCRQDASVLRHPRFDRPGKLAAVKPIASLLRDMAVSSLQVRLLENAAFG